MWAKVMLEILILEFNEFKTSSHPGYPITSFSALQSDDPSGDGYVANGDARVHKIVADEVWRRSLTRNYMTYVHRRNAVIQLPRPENRSHGSCWSGSSGW